MRRLLDSVTEHRGFVYMAAAMSGLPRGELRQIERREVDLVNKQLVVRAEISKTKKDDILPLHEEMVALLSNRTHLMGPHDCVFRPMPSIRTFKKDLERAGIQYKDENGRYLDLHSLRGTFATRLLRSGVYPSHARRLTRHASVKTLEKYYDGLGLSEAEQAIRRLPGLGDAGEDAK